MTKLKKKAKKKLLERTNVMLGGIDKKRAMKVAKKMEGSTNVSKGIREALRLAALADVED